MTSDPFPGPEAIEAAARDAFWSDDLGGHIKGGWTWETIPDTGRANYRKVVEAALRAGAKAQPVVALPPCPTCGGWGWVPDNTGKPPGVYIGKDDPPCFSCRGLGVDRLIPVSEIREWIAGQREDIHPLGFPTTAPLLLDRVARWLNER